MAQSVVDDFNDLKELGIDCDDSLSQAFSKAANHVQTLLPIDNQMLLTLYGYYKQGSEGSCTIPKPSFYDFKAKSKWEAWHKLGEMSRNEAKQLYIETIKKLDPNFDLIKDNKECWVSVSVPQYDLVSNESDKNIVDYIRDNNVKKVSKLIRRVEVDKVDENGMGLIHWAADQGSAAILTILLSSGADVNLRDSQNQTALHYAASCGHIDCIKLLLTNGADKQVLDNDGFSPVDVACDNLIKELL